MKIVIYDLETTGLDPKVNDIAQFAALTFDTCTGEISNEICFPVQFDMEKATKEALEIIGYDENKPKWANPVTPEKALAKIQSYFNQAKSQGLKKTSAKGRSYEVAILAGYNNRFDDEFLLEYAKRKTQGGLFLAGSFGRTIDVYQLVLGDFYKRNFSSEMVVDMPLKLKDSAKIYGYDLIDAHDALADVKATLYILLQLLKKPSLKKIKTA